MRVVVVRDGLRALRPSAAKGGLMDCPECAKNGKIVAMKKDRGSRPGRRPERAEAVFIEDDMWVCPTCDYVEVVKD